MFPNEQDNIKTLLLRKEDLAYWNWDISPSHGKMSMLPDLSMEFS